MRRWIVAIFLSVALVSGVALADKPEKKSAVLVEFHYLPRCAGLDCPPWHIPPDIDFCFQVGDTFYIGGSRPWGVPLGESRLNRRRSEEHTSELPSRPHIVCRLLLLKKK